MTLVNLLLDRGANGAFLLQNLYGSKPGDNQMIQLLISKGVQIRSEQGAQALRGAAETGNLDTVKLLVENGVNVNARDNDGKTALSVAYDKGEIEVYNYLKEHGAIDFEPRQAAAQPASPAQSSSTTNVYVQPSTPGRHNPLLLNQAAMSEKKLRMHSNHLYKAALILLLDHRKR